MDWEIFPDHDIIWCDPPWEQKMVNFFQTLMRKDTGMVISHNISEILDQLAKLSNPFLPLFIEYSTSGSELVVSAMNRYHHRLIATVNVIQTNGRASKLLCFNTPIIPIVKRTGFGVITDTLKSLPQPVIVFDPFAGIGNSAKAVRAAGCTYIGSEINPERFKRLVKNNP